MKLRLSLLLLALCAEGFPMGAPRQEPTATPTPRPTVAVTRTPAADNTATTNNPTFGRPLNPTDPTLCQPMGLGAGEVGLGCSGLGDPLPETN